LIAGLGIDLVEIERIAGALARNGDAFARRILHPSEDVARLARADGPTHLAGLFAAKEAVMKALGTGMAGAAFHEIEVRHDAGGQPHVRLHAGALARAEAMGVAGWHLSITHTRTTAAAVAIALA
jgi:holo-[acyl-carrier protein] synthase